MLSSCYGDGYMIALAYTDNSGTVYLTVLAYILFVLTLEVGLICSGTLTVCAPKLVSK